MTDIALGGTADRVPRFVDNEIDTGTMYFSHAVLDLEVVVKYGETDQGKCRTWVVLF